MDLPALGLSELRAIVTDSGELAKGARIVDEGGLAHLARHDRKLFADASGSQVYKVQISFDDKGPRARCSCMAARSRPFCKHAAALLVAWSRSPDAFAVSDAPPPGAAEGRKRAVKQGAIDPAALMKQGVAQVATLVRELAIAGVAALADDRPPQIRALGENLREHRLRRLSGKTIALADLVAGARGRGPQFDESAYAELLADLVLTARKLDKHLAGEPLDARHVEELIGKTWTKKDRAPVAGLDLLEVGFLTRETADGYVIRESRFVDVATGAHHAEKQILPRAIARTTPAKPSHAGFVLRGAAGSLYPSYPPRRVDLDTLPRTPITADDLERLRATALPDVKAAIAALQEHRKDVFAPDTVPVTVRCDLMIAARGRLQLADAAGAALFLPDDDRVEERLATALANVRLVAAIGDAGLDGALPTLAPLAVLVEGRRGLELRSVMVLDPARGSKKIRAAVAAQTGGRAHWAPIARAMGLSTAAIALGEVREELAGLLFAGLTSVTARRVEPLAARLRELSLAKPADALVALAAREDAGDRLDELIKLHQVLGIALARLVGAVAVDRDELVASPMYASVYVRRSPELLAPDRIVVHLLCGELDRFEAAAHYARWYQQVPAEELLGTVFPTWADGSASPFVALAALRDPARALATARGLLDDGAAPRRSAPPRMATITALRVLETLDDEPARAALVRAAERHADHTTRNMARAALGRLAGNPIDDRAARDELRDQLVNAADKDVRERAAGRLADLGDVDSIGLLRASFEGDVAASVRDAAGRALGRLGDADSVDTFMAALNRRDVGPDRAVTAAYALGHLGDVRGLRTLLAAFESAWRPEIIGGALAAVGPAAIPAVLAFLEDRPGLLKRATTRTLLDALDAVALRAGLLERLERLATADEATIVARAAVLVEVARDRGETAEAVGDRLLALHPGLADKRASREARALARKASAHRKPAS